MPPASHSRAPRIAWATGRSNHRACVWNAAGRRGRRLRPARARVSTFATRFAYAEQIARRSVGPRNVHAAVMPRPPRTGEVLPSKTKQEECAHVQQASYCRSAPWPLAFAVGPAEAAPAAPTTSPLGKVRSECGDASAVGIRGTAATGAAGDRARGSGSAPASSSAPSSPTRPIGRGAATTTTTTPMTAPTTTPPAIAAIRAPSARRTSAPSSGARASTRPIRARSGSAPI